MEDLFKCSYQDHSFKKINSICMNSSCDKIRLACTDCLRYFHKNHMNDIIDFTQFQNQKKNCQNTILQANQLIGTIEQLLDFLRKVLKETTSEILNLSNDYTFQQYQNQVQQMMIWNTIRSQFSKELEEINSNVLNILNNIKGIDGISGNEYQFKLVYMNKRIQSDEKNKGKEDQHSQNSPIPIKLEMISSEIIQNTSCEAFAFSLDLQILLVASGTNILIYEFNSGIMWEIQSINAHESIIDCLIFLQKSNRFISASHDNTIKVWGLNNKQQFQLIQKLNNGHTNRVYCLITNKEESLIISSSEDNTIKFWRYKVEWTCYQTLEQHACGVYSISLSYSGQYLVSCGGDNLISIIKNVSIQEWKVVQNIQVSISGKKVCFIDDDTFIFQPVCGNKIEIFGKVNSKFQQTKSIKVLNCEYENLLFPSKFHSQKNLLMHRYGETLFFFRRINPSNFQLEQSINFNTVNVYGTLTDDWKYLVTWDSVTKKIQVRRLIN